MQQQRTKAQVQAEMRERSDSMSRRVDELEAEVSTTGRTLQSWLGKNLLLGLGGAVAAGLAIGWLLSAGKRRRRALRSAHASLVDKYVDAISEEVRRAVAAGNEADVAVRSALDDRVPLVVYRPKDGEEHGMLREGFDLISKIAFGLVVRHLLDRVTDGLLKDGTSSEAGEAVGSTTTVATAVSENVDG